MQKQCYVDEFCEDIEYNNECNSIFKFLNLYIAYSNGYKYVYFLDIYLNLLVLNNKNVYCAKLGKLKIKKLKNYATYAKLLKKLLEICDFSLKKVDVFNQLPSVRVK